MYKRSSKILLVTALALAVVGCGANPKERGLSGGAIGAGAGAVVGAVTGLSVLQGALIGAGAGAVVGAVTNKDQINLGSLSSGKSDPAPQKTGSPAASPLVRDVQSSLAKSGYTPGPADGVIGPRTSSAISAYQRDNGLPADGVASADLLTHIRNKQS